MISSVDDLHMESGITEEQLDTIFQEKLGVSFQQMKEALSQYLQQQADKVAQDFRVVAPFDDYLKLLDDPAAIANFFCKTAHQPEHWEVGYVGAPHNEHMPEMVSLEFYNLAVDEGDSLKGYVFISFAGVIRHVFAQGDEP